MRIRFNNKRRYNHQNARKPLPAFITYARHRRRRLARHQTIAIETRNSAHANRIRRWECASKRGGGVPKFTTGAFAIAINFGDDVASSEEKKAKYIGPVNPACLLERVLTNRATGEAIRCARRAIATYDPRILRRAGPAGGSYLRIMARSG